MIAIPDTIAEREDDRHQHAAPPRIGFERSENESDISVQQERRRDTNNRDRAADLLIERQSLRRDIGCP